MWAHLQSTPTSLMQNLMFLQPEYQDSSQLPTEDFDALPEDEQACLAPLIKAFHTSQR